MRILPLFICACILFTATKAFACSCMYSDGPLADQVKSAFLDAPSVVLARAETVEGLDPYHFAETTEDGEKQIVEYFATEITEFVALQSWKGEHGKRFYTKIQVNCCLCGYSFQEGVTYLLYLYGPTEDGYYSTSFCTRTQQVSEQTQQEIDILNTLDGLSLIEDSKPTHSDQ